MESPSSLLKASKRAVQRHNFMAYGSSPKTMLSKQLDARMGKGQMSPMKLVKGMKKGKKKMKK